jgi:predicted nucleic-acid-binding protein
MIPANPEYRGAAMKRESLDTNILLRLLLRDIPEQYELALKLVESRKVRYFVSDTAINELVFVLERFYQFSRKQIGQVVEGLLSISTVDCNYELVLSALELYLTNRALSFGDCYLAASAKTMNAAPLWTFDKALASKAESAKLLS